MATIKDDLLDLKLEEGEWKVNGKVCVAMKLAPNGYDENVDREQLNKWFMKKIITYKNAWWIIIGIESHAAQNRPHVNVGFMIQEWGTWHQLPKDILRPYTPFKLEI